MKEKLEKDIDMLTKQANMHAQQQQAHAEQLIATQGAIQYAKKLLAELQEGEGSNE